VETNHPATMSARDYILTAHFNGRQQENTYLSA